MQAKISNKVARSHASSRKGKIRNIIFPLMLILALPLILFVVQQTQELRQRAAETTSSALTRPIFGTYVVRDQYNATPQKKTEVLDYAKIIYPDGMNQGCHEPMWDNPQSIIDKPAQYYGNYWYDAQQRNLLFYPEILQKGIIGRGYVWGSNESQTYFPPNKITPLLEQAIKKVESDCVKNEVTAFKSRITNWRIVNEIFNQDGTRRISRFTNKPFDISHMLTAAREVDPQAKLYIDDYGAEEVNSKSTGILNYMKQLRQLGYPIHGVGFQGHFSLKYPPNFQSIRENIQRFKNEGFEVAFTEVDVAYDGVLGTEAEKQSKQKDIFKNVAQICKEFSNCTLFMLFVFDDNGDWLGPDAKAHPLDTAYQPKPAWYGLNEVLRFIPQTFNDVFPGNFGYTELEKLVLRRAQDGSSINGCTGPDASGKTAFCPSKTVNRAEMAKFMIVAMQQAVSYASNTFTDMAGYDWGIKYAMRMKELKITAGCYDGTRYCPGDPVSRGAMVLFIGRALPGYATYIPPTTPSFSDISPSAGELYKAVEFAKVKGITYGNPGGCNLPGNTFCPNNQVTRIDMVTFLMRAFP